MAINGMNRRNFLQLLGAVVLSGMVDSRAAFALRRQREDEARRRRLAQMNEQFQRNFDELARLYNESLAQQRRFTDFAIAEHDKWWADLQAKGLLA
jgi:hypothetical protein